MDSPGPERVSEVLEAKLRDGDIDAVMALYEADAVFAEVDGVATGLAAIRAAHQRFVDEGLTLRLNDSVALEADGIALVHWSWTVTRRDGSVIDGVSAEVLRRQADGEWKFLIDNSDGSAIGGW